jgi:membrane-bound lytic murein transglycosylase B
VATVESLLDGVEKDQTILDRMARPWEAKPWYAYRRLFLTEKRIAEGKAFYESNRALFERAESKTGVPAEIALAILGVETSYGTTMGDDAVVTALYTLGFHHRRGPFFRKELGHFLRLATDQGWSVTERKGSYAGAMGMGQFMPSSYREYAVDFDADGAIDLFDSRADAIGSVANYLDVHKWKTGGAILVTPTTTGEAPETLVRKGLDLDQTVGELAAAGVVLPDGPYDASTPCRVFGFDVQNDAGEDVREYRVAFQNFWVITRYNRSPLYARAVVELAEALAD